MELRAGLALRQDMYLLNMATWTKLKTSFGGGPEIPFFQYQFDVETTLRDGTTKVEKKTEHDFEPIRVRAHVMKRSKESSG